MKKVLKKIADLIVKTGIFNFVLGHIRIKTLKNLEKKKIPLIRKMLQVYYKDYIHKIDIRYDGNESRRTKVYFITNVFPLWEQSTSNFLKINADIATVFLENNIEVEFILMHHSHLSYLTNNGIKWNDIMEVDHEKIEKKIKEDLYKMYKISEDKIKINILNKQKGHIKLKEYMERVIEFFDNMKISEKDILIFSGGTCKSDLAEILIQKIFAKKIYLTAGATESVECEKYNYVLTYNHELLSKYENAIPPKNVVFSPFEWEKEAELNNDLQILMNELLNKNIKSIFVSSKQKFANHIDDEFIELLNDIMLKYNKFYLLLIGDNRNRILNKLKGKINFEEDRIVVIEFVDSLYVFFRELNKHFKTFYILPRITGSGISNLMAACANIPTTIFKGNDADGNWIPTEYFLQTKEEFLSQIDRFIKNEEEVEKFISDFKKFANQKKIIAKRFYLDLLK